MGEETGRKGIEGERLKGKVWRGREWRAGTKGEEKMEERAEIGR